jgi:hypothetical protein
MRVAIVLEDSGNEFVGNERSGIEARFHFGAPRMAERGEVTELLPHFEEGSAEFFEDLAGLGAFSGTLDSDEEEVHENWL